MDLDLSEYHLAYFTFSPKQDPLGLTNEDTVSFHHPSVTSNFIINGANLSYVVSTLTGGVGPVSEETVPTARMFDTKGGVLPDAYTWKIDESLRRSKNVLEIENVYVYSLLGTDHHQLIKKGIMEHGAAAASYYCQDKQRYYTTKEHGTAYYQTNRKADPDHGIAIVGWDDDYPVEAFQPGHRPKKPGAWLVRNSWGEVDYFTTGGYFWLSYEDESFTHRNTEGKNPYAYIYDGRPSGAYRQQYQYDGGIIHEYSETITEQNATAYANIFTAQGNKRLEAVSIHTDRSYANAPCRLEIYTDVKNVPDQGNPVYQEDIRVPGNGYFTFPLSKKITIKQGQTFSVVIKPTDSWQLTYICTDRTYDPEKSAFISKNSTQPNQSFIFHGAQQQWQDLHDEKFYAYENGTSLCIKAFMNDIDAANDDSQNPQGDSPQVQDDHTVLQGWREENGTRFYYIDGVKQCSRWIDDLYYVDESGKMLTSTFTPDGYRVGADGKWVKGRWIKDRIGWWYRYEDGFFHKAEWKKIDKKWYHFDRQGYISISKWVEDYYLGADGAMLESAFTPDGYYVNADGKWDRTVPRRR